MLDLGTAVGYLLLDTSGFEKGISKSMSSFKTLKDSTSTANDKLKAMGSITADVGEKLTKYVALPLAGLAAGSLAAASTFEGAMNKLKSSTGAAEDQMQSFETVLRNVYRGGYGEGYEDIADAIALINQQLGDMSPEQLEQTTESALLLRDVFEYDLNESIRATSALMGNFGISSQEAFDLIAYGAQNGLDFSGELLDTISEYSPQFKKLGLDAYEMFDILASGADAGAWNLDKVGDAIKELSIRAIDMSSTTQEAYAILGLNTQQMAQYFAQGGDAAKGAFNMIIQGLASIEDPVQQSIAGVGLFGTMWEDLGPDVVTQLANISGESKNAKGSINELNEAKMDSFQNQLEETKRMLSDLGVELGLQLLPYVKKLLEFLQNGIEFFAGLDDGTKTFIVTIAALVAALGIGITIVTKLAAAITAISTALGILGVSASVSLPAILAIIAALTVLVGLLVALNSGKDKSDRGGGFVDTRDLSLPKSRVSSGSYASGLDYVPSDRTVDVHEGESIITKQDRRDIMSELDNLSRQNSRPIQINTTIELDGAVLANKQYQYTEQESINRGRPQYT